MIELIKVVVIAYLHILDPKGQGYHLSHLLAALDFALLVILAIKALLPGVSIHRIT